MEEDNKQKNKNDLRLFSPLGQLPTNVTVRSLIPITSSTVARSAKLRKDFVIGGTLHVDGDVTTINDTTDESTVASFIFQKGELHKDLLLECKFHGIYSTSDAVDTLTFTLKLNSTTVDTFTTTAAEVTDVPWFIEETIIIKTIGATGTASHFLKAESNSVSASAGATADLTVDTTVSQTLSLTVTWDDADAANTVSITQFILKAF